MAGVVVVAVLGGCGVAAPGRTVEPPDTTLLDSTTSSTVVAPPPTSTTVVPEPVVESLPGEAQPAQPAIWPSAEVVFADPIEAAADFNSTIGGSSPAAVGEFRAYRDGVGEIPIYRLDEDGQATPMSRSTLIMARLEPTGGWFVIEARGGDAWIFFPQRGAVVAGGSVEVHGGADGPEPKVSYEAFLAGDRAVRYDAGDAVVVSLDDPPMERYSATVDLGAAPAGTTAVVWVESDDGTGSGDFSAVPVVVSDPLSVVLPGTVQLAQPAIWPAPNVVFADPVDVAVEFISRFVDSSPAAVGEFEPLGEGVGEIAIHGFDELVVIVDTRNERSRLTVRQLAPTNGWYIVAARSDRATITSPPAGAVVFAGPVKLVGEASGHEGNMNYLAALAGDWGVRYDEGYTQVGLYDPLPYRVTMDLSAAPAGSTAFLMVISDSGIGQGGFSAVPVLVLDQLPATR
jgi:hypothetical protein